MSHKRRYLTLSDAVTIARRTEARRPSAIFLDGAWRTDKPTGDFAIAVVGDAEMTQEQTQDWLDAIECQATYEDPLNLGMTYYVFPKEVLPSYRKALKEQERRLLFVTNSCDVGLCNCNGCTRCGGCPDQGIGGKIPRREEQRKALEKASVLNLSLAHLTDQTLFKMQWERKISGVTYAKLTRNNPDVPAGLMTVGYLVAEDEESVSGERCPADLMACLEFAKSQKCQWIRFTNETEPCDLLLPTYPKIYKHSVMGKCELSPDDNTCLGTMEEQWECAYCDAYEREVQK